VLLYKITEHRLNAIVVTYKTVTTDFKNSTWLILTLSDSNGIQGIANDYTIDTLCTVCLM